jgi:DNA-binding SARP family transcriptional activator/tetratricopeptide (TPR) repeat protein
MISFRTLGPLDLKGPDGNTLHSILTGSKRVGLLAYLAVQTAGGFHRRDTLLAFFWPESDQERARNSLRNALSVLRRGLGDGVVATRGDEEVGLAEGRFWCDAAEFRKALAEGRPAEALELYRGDLLHGFHVPDVPEFERWLDRERARLREEAANAAGVLAERARVEGRPAEAVRWARRATEILPEDEGAIRRLVSLMHVAGDRAGALRTYEEFAGLLAQQYGGEPSAETRKLMEHVRAHPGPELQREEFEARPEIARTEAVRSEPELRAFPELVERRAPTRDRAVGRIRFGRGRKALGALVAAVVALGLGIAAWTASPGPHARAGSAPSVERIAILPFSAHGGRTAGFLAGGMVQLLSAKLDGVGGLRTTDPNALLSFVGENGGRGSSPERGSEVAARFGADLYILGDVVEMGGRLQVAAALYDRASEEPVARAHVEGEAARAFELVDRLAAELLAGRIEGPGSEMVQLATRTTHSLPALASYFRGEEQFRGGRYEAAIEALQHAVAEDSTFALAHYRLAIAADWADQGALSRRAAERAGRYDDRLPERERRLLEAYGAYSRQEIDRAESLYLAILRDYPNDLEASHQLGEVRFHFNAVRGRSLTESRADFERVLGMNPRHGPALVHLARIAATQGRYPRVDSLVARLLRVEPQGDRALEMRALRAFTLGGAQERERVLADLRRAEDDIVYLSVLTVAIHGQDLPGAARIAGLLTERDPATSAWERGHGLLSELELAGGRWSGAARHLQEIESARTPGSAFPSRAFIAAAALAIPPREERERLWAEVQKWRPVADWSAASRAPGELLPAHFRAYVLGGLSVQLGDLATAERAAAELARLDRLGNPPGLGHALSRSLRAQIALRRGNSGVALTLLEQAPAEAPWVFGGAFGGMAPDRFTRAEALQRLGRHQEALRWYGSFPDPAYSGLAYLAPSHLRQGEIHERLGNQKLAAAHYRRVLALWKDCDPELRPMVREVEDRLARLEPARASR